MFQVKQVNSQQNLEQLDLFCCYDTAVMAGAACLTADHWLSHCTCTCTRVLTAFSNKGKRH